MSAFAIFFLRQFFLNMSREVEEAAMLDGAKHLRIFFKSSSPMPQRPLATLALLTFIGPMERILLAAPGRPTKTT